MGHHNMTTLWLDLETYSTVPIKHGTHAYAEAAEVLLVAWAYDDEPVAVWDMTDGTRTLGQVQMLIDSADRVVIHNSAFDRTVLRHVGVHVPVDKVTDTMVLALEHSLPASLGALCDVLGVPTDKAKDKSGKRLIHLLTKPRAKNVKVRRATRETHPDEWQEFIEYARLDVDAMRSVHGRLPNWNNSSGERHLWLLDQRINDRGVRCDLGLAEAALRAFQRTAGSLAARTSILTRGVVASLTQRQKLVDYLGTHHQFEVKDMTKATVASLLQGDLHPEVRELLEIRQQASATSPAKYGTILDAVSSDGRLRGTIQFCGASRTGRDSGRLFQPQNLPRPTMRPEQIEFGIEAMKIDCEDLLFDNVSELCASAVRGCLVAAPGHKLVVADLSNIEGRVLAWLAGEEWKVTAFYAYDRGDGHDLYKITAGRILGKSPGDVTKAERQSQGKVPELAGGFGGGVGAYRKMGGAKFDAMGDEEIGELVRAWRTQHPATVSMWYAVERTIRAVIEKPELGTVETHKLQFDMRDGWLRIRLPSKRYLSYSNARIEDGTILYDGNNQYTRKWEALETYYGRAVENIVQAVARDIFMGGMRRAEAAGYPVVLRVHDELVCEVPDEPQYTVEGLAACMTYGETWSTALPLAAAGHEMYRYAKMD
jgi:DNA polymerase